MAINRADLITRLSDIVGDQMAQITPVIELEIDNTIRRLTRNYVFYWNTDILENQPHTNGVITLPDNTGKVLSFFDTANLPGSLKYYPMPAEQFYVAKTYNTTNNVGVQHDTNVTYFIPKRDDDGNETINLNRVPTDSTTFNIVYTKTLPGLTNRVPDHLYTFILSETAYVMLNDQESHDTNLTMAYLKIAERELDMEMQQSKNKCFNQFNNPVVPPSHIINTKSSGF